MSDVAIVSMRLIDMWRNHPAQDNSRVCSKCGERVGLYPTGQRVLRGNPGARIWCQVCALKDRREGDLAMPAGLWADIFSESRESYEVGKA